MNSAATILIIDDDIDLCKSLQKLLAQHGFKTILAHHSKDIEEIIKSNQIDLILLDIILPGDFDGIAVCKQLRQITAAPIIMLTGIEDDVEKILSLEIGADNYLTKPFNSRVLLAHIHASLRRNAVQLTSDSPNHLVAMDYQIYEFLDWKLNVTARVLLSPENKLIKLTSAEFFLLQGFVNHPQCVLSRDQLLTFVNVNSASFDRSVDILVSRLRAKIEGDAKRSKIIATVRNSGYLLACCVTKQFYTSLQWKELISAVN